MAKSVTFVRVATGIVRGLSVWDVFMITSASNGARTHTKTTVQF